MLVAGGTGRLGAQVVAGLLAGGHEVRVLARGKRPPPAEITGAQLIAGSVSDPAVVARAVEGVEVVVSTVTGFPFVSPTRVDLQGTRVLADAAGRAGADLVLVSVAGASPDSRVGLFRAKYQAEQVLRRSNLGWTIIRPEAFADLWVDLLTTTAGGSHRPLVFGRGNNPIGWVAVRDVSALTVRAVQSASLRQKTLTISGPQRLTLTELASRVMAVHGWSGDPRHVPTGALRLASMLPGRPGRQAEAALAMDVMAPAHDDARREVAHLPCTPVETVLASDHAGSV
nr:NAD(P)H-binding protein [Nocardioides mesophilus]